MAEAQLGTVFDPILFGKLVTGAWYSNARLKKSGMEILSQGKFKCASCGFQSRSSMQVPHGYMIPVDRKHPALLALEGNGDCLCPMCASTLGINWAVAGVVQAEKVIESPGLLIAQSSLSQVEINRIALHVISVLASRTPSESSALSSAARDIDAAMTALNQELGASIPFYRGKDSDFARALALLPENYYEQRQQIIGQLRWWPNVRFWREQGAYWMKATYKSVQDKDSSLQEALA